MNFYPEHFNYNVMHQYEVLATIEYPGIRLQRDTFIIFFTHIVRLLKIHFFYAVHHIIAFMEFEPFGHH